MIFEKHLNLKDRHAAFGASQSAWLRYDDEKFISVVHSREAMERGTKLHEWAKMTIDLGIKQPRSDKTLYKYVNDAIGYKMTTEQPLYYSEYFFGTADAISFMDDVLRIHDLKTGIGQVHIDQLMIYAALFCLEYKIKPGAITIELRIYQNDEIMICNPEVEDILHIMDKIVHLNKIREKELMMRR